MLGSCLLMSPGFSGYVASERDASCHFRLSLGPDVDIELVSADAERFAGGVAGERRVSSSSSLTGADQTLSSYPRSLIAFSDDCPARDQPSAHQFSVVSAEENKQEVKGQYSITLN